MIIIHKFIIRIFEILLNTFYQIIFKFMDIQIAKNSNKQKTFISQQVCSVPFVPRIVTYV